MAMDDAATAFLMLHRIGIAFGVGAITLLTMLVADFLRCRPVTTERYDVARLVSKIATAGLTLLWLSGPWFFGALCLVDVREPPGPHHLASFIVASILSIAVVVINTTVLPIIK